MAKKKNEFDCMYMTVRDEEDGIGVAYDRAGDFSAFIEIENPVEQYSADIDAYYEACDFFTSIIKILGEGYALQKQDIFYRQTFNKEIPKNAGFLSKGYLSYFQGREYTGLKTHLIITQEVNRSSFQMFDKKKWKDFIQKINKIVDVLNAKKMYYHVLNAGEIQEYLYRFLSVSHKEGPFSFDNFKSSDNYLKAGNKIIKMIDLIDIDEIVLPNKIKPFVERKGLPMDLCAFLSNVPGAESIIYTQSIIIPSQRKENSKLAANKNRKESIPDPANLLAAGDIENIIKAVAQDNHMLVYTNFTVMVIATGDSDALEKPFNYVEKQFYDIGVGINKNAYNQLELFINSFPGNMYSLKKYERFLCLHDAAVCFLFKEKLRKDEITPLEVYYTDRQGKPIIIDITGKEGKIKYTTNSNFFSLGPSGSGKSFHMNSIIRQLAEQETDIVMVDTGNSYEGLCNYFSGTYISYTEEKPITMNPFKITEEELNIEKKDFIKNLIILIWLGPDATVSKTVDNLMDIVIQSYYQYYFHPFTGFSEEKKEELRSSLLLEMKAEDYNGDLYESPEEREIRQKAEEKIKKLEQLEQRGEGGEKENAKRAISRLLENNEIKREDLIAPEERMLKIINHEIEVRENRIREIKVNNLSFNSFYEFSVQYIPIICKENNIRNFDMVSYRFVLKSFYKGGIYAKTLNDDLDSSLFDQKFIVFEVDAIKDNKLLFPIVTLIIMDVFIQKMRLKKTRKALIIEEAWKAIASPVMAGQIKYLYKTVRKFWGIVGVVTQSLDDIISNETVKEAIIDNSEIMILLDQEKFKDRFSEIASLLGLNDVECRKIWTINQLDNKDGRSFFKEVYIKRGNKGDVFGVEESPQSYMAYTTERVEKDALKIYIQRYGDYQDAITHFCKDWEECCEKRAKADTYANIVNQALKIYHENYGEMHENAEERFIEDWKKNEAKENSFPYSVYKSKTIKG